jgi:flagellar FliL protein
MNERSSVDDANDAEPTDGAEAVTPTPRRRRRFAILAGAAFFVLVLAGGGVFAVTGGADSLFGGGDPSDAAAQAQKRVVFYPLPDLVVSLDAGDKRAAFLKLRVNLELPESGDQARIEQMLPRIVDYCQIYLRDLRVDDLRGSAGSMRVREELLRRIRAAVAPAPVNDVLFAEMLIH